MWFPFLTTIIPTRPWPITISYTYSFYNSKLTLHWNRESYHCLRRRRTIVICICWNPHTTSKWLKPHTQCRAANALIKVCILSISCSLPACVVCSRLSLCVWSSDNDGALYSLSWCRVNRRKTRLVATPKANASTLQSTHKTPACPSIRRPFNKRQVIAIVKFRTSSSDILYTLRLRHKCLALLLCYCLLHAIECLFVFFSWFTF